MARPLRRREIKKIEPYVRLVLASEILRRLKGGMGSCVREYCAATGLSYYKVSVAIKEAAAGILGPLIQVVESKQASFVRIGTDGSLSLVPREILDKNFLRRASKPSGSAGRIFTISLKGFPLQVNSSTRLDAGALGESLKPILNVAVERLKKADITEYKFIKTLAVLVLRCATDIIQNVVQRYSRIQFIDNRIDELDSLLGPVTYAERCVEQSKRRRELLKHLNQWVSLLEAPQVFA